MNEALGGILSRRIDRTPVAVIDLETTGLTCGLDRVVEVSVVRVDPESGIELVFDTLVNPGRPMAATEIHGITDADVADAPTFGQIAGDLIAALAGCPIAAYNVYFDIKFLAAEFQQIGLHVEPPHFCLMYLRPMLGLGPRCPLEDACRQHEIRYGALHAATHDAMAAARLMRMYRGVMAEQRITTFGRLAKLKPYKFVASFANRPLSPAAASPFAPNARLKSRYAGDDPGDEPAGEESPATTGRRRPAAAYWEALKAVLSDLRVSDQEIERLREKRGELGLDDEQIRSIHAKAYVGVLSQLVADNRLDARESAVIQRLHACLSKLGWAPGEA